MATGILAAACMCLMLGQDSSDTLYFNYRNHRVPVDVPIALRPEIRELLLYASADQGRTWNHVAGPITPDKDHFAFFAPGDGTYWLRVVQVNRNGVQDPDDRIIKNGPPNMKMVIDTRKPIIKSSQAQRHEDEIYVNWDVQEENLDPHGMRLEYQIKDAPADAWKSVPIHAGLKGQARFNPGHKQPLMVRLTVRDLAKNESYSPAQVAGTLIAASFDTPGSVGPQNPLNTPVAPKEIVLPASSGDTVKKPNLPPPPVGIEMPVDKTLFVKPGGVIVPAPVTKENAVEKVVADSRLPPPPIAAPRLGLRDAAPPKDTPFDVKPIANAVPPRKALPTLQYVNQHQVTLEYELKRVGPSGIGGIEVWLTKDDGETWEPFAADEDEQSGAVNRRQQRQFDLRDTLDRPFADGFYGLTLVVKNRAGLGKKPRPGDAPEIRIEIDTQSPDTQLYMPIPDPQNPEQVLLKWSARDKNLADRPIHLEYAVQPDGEWLPVKLDLENTGRYTNERVTGDYSWRVPPNTPLQVYLRMRVRDKAGNERVLVTPRPQYVDLTEPEGALIGVQPSGKAP